MVGATESAEAAKGCCNKKYRQPKSFRSRRLNKLLPPKLLCEVKAEVDEDVDQ